MPIYAYRCESCGHEKDVLRKLSDAPLTQCPACGKDTFSKQVTAAGFQLKGSGWYVTDFRGGSSNNGKSSNGGNENASAATGAETSASANSDSGASASNDSANAKPAESASASSESSKPSGNSSSNAAASGAA